MRSIHERAIQASKFMEEVNYYTSLGEEKINTLKNLDLFVLDVSIRETTVGSLRGHTLENKKLIYEQIKKCKFQYFIIEAFTEENRVGDVLLEELNKEKEDLSNAVAFSEVWESIVDKVPQDQPIPIGMLKCQQFGVPNVVLEIDLMYYKVDYTLFKTIEILEIRIMWMRQNVAKDSKIFVNFRDFGDTMTNYPERIWEVTNYLSSLPDEERITGILYEDLGKYHKDLLGGWTKAVRMEMMRCGWVDGELLFHQHEQWGTMHGNVLECLAMGATGVWAGLCAEGAAMGHADTCTTILNLVRLGNKKVQKKFNCKMLRDAAINVTKIVTGMPPPPRQPIYGERAIDMVFGFVFSGIADNAKQFVEGFDLADFLGLEKPMRISGIASAEMILEKLKTVFGDDHQFTIEIAKDMKSQMLANARDGRKEEYNSQAGLAILFDQAGGKLTSKMAEIISDSTKNSRYIEGIIDEIKEDWKIWDAKDGVEDNQISFRHFYDGFMAPYFGCYRCEDSQKALSALDMDNDGMIDWLEFKTFLVWAGREYPNVANRQELMDHAFRYGLIPAMQEELEKIVNESKEPGFLRDPMPFTE